MTLVQRRILTAMLGLLLLVVSPLIILYSAGYRYNFKKFRVEKVGLLYVTTKPNDTKILVNNQEYHVGNELVLRSIPPGEHEVTLTSEGYFPWQKKLEIAKGQSTFITDQVLFLDQEEEPFELFTNKLQPILSEKNLHFFQSSQFLFVYNFLDHSVLELQLPVDREITLPTLSKNQKQFVFQQDGLWLELNLETETILPLDLPETITELTFIDNQLFARTPAGVFRIEEELVPFIEQEHVQDILAAEQGIWLLTSDQRRQHTFLYRVFEANGRPQLIDQFPYAEEIQLVEDYRGFLTIHDQINSILYLVDTATTIPTTEALFGVRHWEWNTNHSSLLTSTEFELTIHHFDNGITQELLTRLSTPIDEVAWYADESHVFYVKQNSLFLIERDGRDRRNEYELADVSEDLIILGSDKESIEFFSSTETSSLFIKRYLTQ